MFCFNRCALVDTVLLYTVTLVRLIVMVEKPSFVVEAALSIIDLSNK